MKPITFENLRRLMGGGRKKKEKESSFKRSESFKRISIRKNYLDRGGKKKQHQKQLEALEGCTSSASSVPEEKPVLEKKRTQRQAAPAAVQSSAGTSAPATAAAAAAAAVAVEDAPPSFVAYGQWLKGMRIGDGQSSSTTGIKGSERTVIYIPASDDVQYPGNGSTEVFVSSKSTTSTCRSSEEIVHVLREASMEKVPEKHKPHQDTSCGRTSSTSTELPAKTSSRRSSSTSVAVTTELPTMRPSARSTERNCDKIPTRTGISCDRLTSHPKPTRLSRKFSNDSAVEMFPWGDSVEVLKMDRSPVLSRRHVRPSPPTSLLIEPSGADEMCSLSVSLGRIWMDAPMAMSPRSLELPRPTPAPVESVHHSLDSALKERRDDPIINRLQTHYPKKPLLSPQSSSGVVSRTLSSSTQNSETKTASSTTSTNMFSSKDSGFSFSISIPKLTDFSSGPSLSSGGGGGGFFRNKRPKPKLSVSRDGYFKRTSGALETKSNSMKRGGSHRKRTSGRAKKKSPPARSDLYQVVVNRPQRSLKNLKLDPMIFVPPEKRSNSVRKKPSFKLTVKEIRDYCSAKDELPNVYQSIHSDSAESLYECISGDFDVASPEDISGRISRLDTLSVDEDGYDFPSTSYEPNPVPVYKNSFGKTNCLSITDDINYLTAEDFYSNGKKCSLREFYVASEKCSEEETISGVVMAPQSDSETKSANNAGGSSLEWSSEDDDEDEPDDEEEDEGAVAGDVDSDVLLEYSDIECVPLGVSPVPRKRPVRRRKSALSQKRAVSYVARPGIHRAPSTLRASQRRKKGK